MPQVRADHARLPAARLTRPVVTAAVVALAFAGCGGGDSAKAPATPTPHASRTPAATVEPAVTPSGAPLASAPLAHTDGAGRVELLGLTPSAKGTVTVRLRVVDDGPRPLRLGGAFADTARGNKVGGVLGAGGIALVDGTHNRVYYPLSTPEGVCLCSDLGAVDVAPGAAQDIYATFPAPERASRVMVWVPLAPPFADIAIGSGRAGPLPAGALDPARVGLAGPVVRALVSTAEGSVASVDDKGDDTSVRLSADVLFALNKAGLSQRASAVLRDVAAKIDRSRGASVAIDGYTDTTGTDAINNPLSRRRALAVESRLRRLVTRRGIAFRSVGHGSRDPIADNASPEGRRRNRRVTVTFARPSEPVSTTPRPSAAPAASGKLAVVASVRPHFDSPRSLEREAGRLRFDVNDLRGDSSGLVTLVWTLTDVSRSPQFLAAALPKWQSLEYSGPATSGARLVDRAARLRYRPARDGEDACLCTPLTLTARATIAPGQSVTYAAVYRVPSSVRTLDVELPWYSRRVVLRGLAIR